jgi:hypothetical protein
MVMAIRTRLLPVLALLASLALAACGSGAHAHHTRTAHAGVLAAPSLSTVPAPGPTGKPADADAVRVIKAWSTALRRGDIATAATYFALPSALVNGSASSGGFDVIHIFNRTQALVANESLPCGARFDSADQRGRYVNALFTLTGRPGPGGSDCGGAVGLTARTNFLIVDGRIVVWIRAPDDPGDNRGAAPQPPAQTQPQAPQPGPGGVIPIA